MKTKQQRADYYRRWYLKNRQRRLAQNKRYRQEHIEQYKLWREKNKERLNKLAYARKIAKGWKPKTDWLYTQKICRRCKREGIPLIKSINTSDRIYWICRECNLFYSKKYRSTKKGRERVRLAVYNSIKRHPRKQKARVILNMNVKLGRIIKPKICSICKKKNKIEAHHSNYNKPLDVIWTCRPCHTLL